MYNDSKGFQFKLRLIQAIFFNQDQQGAFFTLSITNKSKQYNTSSFRVISNIMDLRQCAPININLEDNKHSVLKISLNCCQDHSSYETQIDYRIIEILMNRGRNGEAKKKKHILAFPLYGRARNIIGQLKIKLSVIQRHAQVYSTDQLINQKKVGRNLVFSQNGEDDYFLPVYSKLIKLKIDGSLQENNLKLIGHEQKPPIDAFSKKTLTRTDPFQPFKEEISLIELRDSQQGRTNSHQQCEMIDFDHHSSPSRQPHELEEQQAMDVPEDCRHLFQKISQINRRYAPLQRIPSQEQFSEDFSDLSQQNPNLESCLSEEQISHPLQQVQQLLKQLDLLRFAQKLQQPEAQKA